MAPSTSARSPVPAEFSAAFRARLAPRVFTSRTLSSRSWVSSLKRLAAKVLVSMMSALALRVFSWISVTISGWERFARGRRGGRSRRHVLPAACRRRRPRSGPSRRAILPSSGSNQNLSRFVTHRAEGRGCVCRLTSSSGICSAGVGTCHERLLSRRLPRLPRARPSTALDERRGFRSTTLPLQHGETGISMPPGQAALRLRVQVRIGRVRGGALEVRLHPSLPILFQHEVPCALRAGTREEKARQASRGIWGHSHAEQYELAYRGNGIGEGGADCRLGHFADRR